MHHWASNDAPSERKHLLCETSRPFFSQKHANTCNVARGQRFKLAASSAETSPGCTSHTSPNFFSHSSAMAHNHTHLLEARVRPGPEFDMISVNALEFDVQCARHVLHMKRCVDDAMVMESELQKHHRQHGEQMCCVKLAIGCAAPAGTTSGARTAKQRGLKHSRRGCQWRKKDQGGAFSRPPGLCMR